MDLLLIIAGLGAALIASLFGWKRTAEKAKEAERRADLEAEMRELENEAAIQSDAGLAERLSRGGM